MKERSENTGLNEKAEKFQTNIITPDYLSYGIKELQSSGQQLFDDTGWDEPTNLLSYENYDGEV